MTEYNGIKVGDLITAYWKGYFELIKIIPRYKIDQYPNHTYDYYEGAEPYSPIFVFIQRYKADGRIFKSKTEKQCDASYCKLAKDSIKKELLRLQNTYRKLEDICNDL